MKSTFKKIELRTKKSWSFLILIYSFLSICYAVDESLPPLGFKFQCLDPLGGNLTMPCNWYYEGGMTPTGFLFRASKENLEGGRYLTGMRIQGIVDVYKNNRVSPFDVVMMNKNNFKKSAKIIIKDCSEENSPPFRKTCLETIQENPYNSNDDFHIIYSFFWDEKLDWVVTSIFGAPESEWKEAKEIYGVMGRFTIIDLSKMKLEKNTQNSPPFSDGLPVPQPIK